MADTTFRQRAYNFYLQQGFQPHQAAALAGQAEWESGGNPTASHDKGTGFGIFGFRDPTSGQGRKTDLFNWAKANNLDPNDETTQLKFSVHELNTSEKAAGDALRASTDITGATNAVIGYLRPQGWSADNPQGGHGYQGRLVNAAEISGNPPSTTEVASTTPTVTPQSGLLAAQQAQLDQQRLLMERQKTQAEQDKQEAAYKDLMTTGMGLLGKGTTPAPQLQVQAPEPHIPQPQPMQWPTMPGMPDFTQMLAQQRLQRRA